MRVYVAGAWHNRDFVSTVMASVKGAGHGITLDWTAMPEPPPDDRAVARVEQRAVRSSDAVVLVWEPEMLGALIEVGMALANNTPVVIYPRPERRSVFWALSLVHIASTWPEALNQLRDIENNLWTADHPAYDEMGQ